MADLPKVVDVIVVGYGAAGGAAAITAHKELKKKKASPEVLIIDKAKRPGGNSLVSSAMMIYPTSDTKPEDLVDYLTAVCNGTTDRALVKAFVDGLLKNEEWFKELDSERGVLEVYDYKQVDPSYSYYIPDKTFPGIPGAEKVKLQLKRLKQGASGTTQPTGGARVMHLITKEVEKRAGMKVVSETPVTKLLRDANGVHSVEVTQPGGQQATIRARHGVVLACGGFEYNDALKRDFLRPQTIGCLGNPSNQGDGIALVEGIGAALWHMGAVASVLGFQPPNANGETWEAGFALTMRNPGFIYVDSRGDRFVDETKLEAHNASLATEEFDMRNFRYPRLPSHLIMNKANAFGKAIAMNIFSYNVVVKGYKWSNDNKTERDKGWIKESNSIAELSKNTGVPAEALAQTIAQYNESCRRGVDPQFGRSVDSLAELKPPYYSLPLTPLLYNTQGGPRRNERAEVLDRAGVAIKRLYAAGEFGSIWGFRYQTSTNFSEALVYGRIAGKNVAGETALPDTFYYDDELVGEEPVMAEAVR